LTLADDEGTHAVARAERAFLRTLHGGCNVPAGALCERDAQGHLSLRGRVLSLDGRQCLEGREEGWTSNPEVLGRVIAEDLLRQGAGPLVAAERS
jgi:hydroxymethylbilane synthase